MTFRREPAFRHGQPQRTALLLVNLANGNSDRTQYLKIKVVLDLPNQKMVEQITPVMPRVMVGGIVHRGPPRLGDQRGKRRLAPGQQRSDQLHARHQEPLLAHPGEAAHPAPAR